MVSISRRAVMNWAGAGTLGLTVAGTVSKAKAQQKTILKVNSFPGVTNFPIFAADHKGYFADYGISVDLSYTTNSQQQRNGLANGQFQIIQTAADNPVAMVELDKADAVIITGGDNGFNSIIVQPEIKELSNIRGKTVVVDAPNTAFALLLYKALKDAGLNKGDYNVSAVGGTGERLAAMTKDKANVAGIMGLPFIFQATAAGLKSMGPAYKSIGAYQSDCAVVMRPWAKANSESVIGYIKAVVKGRRWILDTANKTEAIQLLADKTRSPAEIAAKSYAVVTDPTDGVAKDAKFDMAGFRNVLKLRAEIEGQWGGNPPPPEKYLELSYYDRAIASL